MRLIFVCILIFIEAAVFLLLPPVKYLLGSAEAEAACELVVLPLIVFPLTCWACGGAAMLKHGPSLALAAASALLFLPAAWLHYGALPLGYAAAYGGCSLAGQVTAYPFRVMRRERKKAS